MAPAARTLPIDETVDLAIGDTDCFSFTLDVASTVILTTGGPGGGACPDTFDVVTSVFTLAGVSIDEFDDSGDDSCGDGSIELPAGDCAVCMNCGPTTTSTLISERRISRPRQQPSVRIFRNSMKNGIWPRLLAAASGAHFTWILPANVSRLVAVSTVPFPAF